MTPEEITNDRESIEQVRLYGAVQGTPAAEAADRWSAALDWGESVQKQLDKTTEMYQESALKLDRLTAENEKLKEKLSEWELGSRGFP